jgi:uncharacterized protein YecE (DUF72 family)
MFRVWLMPREGRMSKPQNFYSGLSGLQLPVPKYQYPPEHRNSSRLTYYSTFFNSIEINSSFYKIPMKTTVAKWSASVRHDFKFTFKLFRDITHVKHLDFNDGHILQFMETISAVGNKKGCLLVQFPPSLPNRYIRQLEKLLQSIQKANPDNSWPVAVEFRNKSWYNDETYNVLEAYNATLVQQDIPISATPFTTTATHFIYLRFHGPTGNYRGTYSDAFLLEHAGYIKEWLAEGKTVYAYFNNTMGDAFNNLSALNKFLSEAHTR